jgi:hypothetical protein
MTFVFLFLRLRIQMSLFPQGATNGRRSLWNLASGLCALLKTGSGLKLSKSRTRSNVRNRSHHYSHLCSFSISVHSWRFSFFHSVHSLMPRMYWRDTPIRYNMNWHLLIIRGSPAKDDIANSADRHMHSLTAEYIRARYQYSSDTKGIGSNRCISIFSFCMSYAHKYEINLCSNTSVM